MRLQKNADSKEEQVYQITKIMFGNENSEPSELHPFSSQEMKRSYRITHKTPFNLQFVVDRIWNWMRQKKNNGVLMSTTTELFPALFSTAEKAANGYHYGNINVVYCCSGRHQTEIWYTVKAPHFGCSVWD